MNNPLISQIKSRLSIVDAYNKYVGGQLERKGSYLWCKCLSQHEKTPSMRIKPDKDQYRCYSCGKFGDTIDLVAESRGLSNAEAIMFLARELNLLDETESPLSQEEQDLLDLEYLMRQQERERIKEQENSIKREYMRLIDIEKLMYSFLSEIKTEADLERPEIQASLKQKDLLSDWINTLADGSLEDKLAVIEASREWMPWTLRKEE